jgi:hypothetical protein
MYVIDTGSRGRPGRPSASVERIAPTERRSGSTSKGERFSRGFWDDLPEGPGLRSPIIPRSELGSLGQLIRAFASSGRMTTVSGDAATSATRSTRPASPSSFALPRSSSSSRAPAVGQHPGIRQPRNGSRCTSTSTPEPTWTRNAVSMIDLDFDVLRHRDGTVELLDEDEFDDHRVTYG